MRSSIYVSFIPSHHTISPHTTVYALSIMSLKLILGVGEGSIYPRDKGLRGSRVDNCPYCVACRFIVIFGVDLDLSDVRFLPII